MHSPMFIHPCSLSHCLLFLCDRAQSQEVKRLFQLEYELLQAATPVKDRGLPTLNAVPHLFSQRLTRWIACSAVEAIVKLLSEKGEDFCVLVQCVGSRRHSQLVCADPMEIPFEQRFAGTVTGASDDEKCVIC
jgi:hypothetical protein